MRIIFLADVPGSGLAGEVKEVKNGYARNYLIPKNLAVVANHDQLQRIESIREVGEERRLREEQDINTLAEHRAQLSIPLTAKLGPSGRFYGAITSSQITEEISRLTERDIDRRSVQLVEPIQEPGAYEVELRLGHGISVIIHVNAVGEGQETEGLAAEETEVAQPEKIVEEEAHEVVVQESSEEEEA